MKIFVSTFALALAQNDYYEYDYQNITGSDWFPESNPDALSGYDTGNTYPAANSRYDAGYGPPKMTCWTCHSSSYEECEAQGEERECHENEADCFLEIRERREGRLFKQIQMGCKAKDACNNMKNNNFQNVADPLMDNSNTQCRPEYKYPHSVCRQCCSEPNCTKEDSWWYPLTRAEWDYTGEEETYTGHGY